MPRNLGLLEVRAVAKVKGPSEIDLAEFKRVAAEVECREGSHRLEPRPEGSSFISI